MEKKSKKVITSQEEADKIVKETKNTIKNTKNKKKKFIIGLVISFVLICSIVSIMLISNSKKQEEKPKESIILIKELEFEINSEVKLLSLVSEDNKVKVTSENETIDTSKLGVKKITIKFLVENKEEEKTFTIKIIDTQAPSIEYQKELSTTVGTEIDLLKDVKVSDNSNEEITATVEGEYDFNKEGTYNLKYVAIDSSKNKTEEDFILKVNKKEETSNSSSNSSNKGSSSSGSSSNKGSSSGGNSGGSSNGGSSSNGCGSKGYSMSQSMAYSWWGCNGAEPNWKVSANNDFGYGVGEAELKKCEAAYGGAGACYNYSSYSYIIDNATGKTVGIFFDFGLVHDGKDVAKGYMLPGRIVYTYKNF